MLWRVRLCKCRLILWELTSTHATTATCHSISKISPPHQSWLMQRTCVLSPPHQSWLMQQTCCSARGGGCVCVRERLRVCAILAGNTQRAVLHCRGEHSAAMSAGPEATSRLRGHGQRPSTRPPVAHVCLLPAHSLFTLTDCICRSGLVSACTGNAYSGSVGDRQAGTRVDCGRPPALMLPRNPGLLIP